ncbi:MAG: tRNA epoxyqueuosine(34) reductase QueG [Silvibacterium sp.]|nr:tRNA epoxyqueuosine(34) reductase QueG [Silvibacterium sp.]
MLLTQSLVDTLAREAGFTAAGVAAVPDNSAPDSIEERRRFEEWVASGAAGEMEYLKRRNDCGDLVRSSVRNAFPWVQSVIVCVANYNSAVERSTDPAPEDSGWIARYAQSGTQTDSGSLRPSDYHKVLLRRLQNVDTRLHESLGPFESRCYVDTGPIVERVYARYAGLGWTGKNTCLINQRLGSWLFLGVILTSLDLSTAERPLLAADRCGSCTRCIDACPTHALTAYQMDASRCISYLTIEKRGSIPEDLRSGIGRNVFGCDICQDVCPWNRRAPETMDSELTPRHELINPALDWLASLDEGPFGDWFFGSPVKRSRFAGFRRNLAIAMGNSGVVRFRSILECWSESADPVLSESAAWAINMLSSKPAG